MFNSATVIVCESCSLKNALQVINVQVISLSDVERGKLHVYIEWLDFSTDPADLKEVW